MQLFTFYIVQYSEKTVAKVVARYSKKIYGLVHFTGTSVKVNDIVQLLQYSSHKIMSKS